MSPRIVALDTETSLIRPALLAPPLVCLTWQASGEDPSIVHHADAEPILREWLRSDALLVGHSVAYDMAVICERYPALRPFVFRAYDEDRVTDTQLREQLLDIASGSYRYRIDKRGRRVEKRYTLEAIADRRTGIKLLKDGWRLSYGEFQDVPLVAWTARAREIQARARERLASLPDPETLRVRSERRRCSRRSRTSAGSSTRRQSSVSVTRSTMLARHSPSTRRRRSTRRSSPTNSGSHVQRSGCTSRAHGARRPTPLASIPFGARSRRCSPRPRTTSNSPGS